MDFLGRMIVLFLGWILLDGVVRATRDEEKSVVRTRYPKGLCST